MLNLFLVHTEKGNRDDATNHTESHYVLCIHFERHLNILSHRMPLLLVIMTCTGDSNICAKYFLLRFTFIFIFSFNVQHSLCVIAQLIFV